MNFTKSFLNGKFVGFKKGAGFETCPTNGIQFQLERLSLPRLLWTAQNILRIARQGFCAHTGDVFEIREPLNAVPLGAFGFRCRRNDGQEVS